MHLKHRACLRHKDAKEVAGSENPSQPVNDVKATATGAPAEPAAAAAPTPPASRKRAAPGDSTFVMAEKKRRAEPAPAPAPSAAVAAGSVAPVAPTPVGGTATPGSASALGNSIEIRVLLDARWTGGVIGKGGAVIREYRQLSRANINVSNSAPGITHRIVSINGPETCVMSALGMVSNNVTSQGAQASQYARTPDEKLQSMAPSLSILVPGGAVPALSGQAAPEAVASRTGAHVDMSQEPLPGSTDRSLTLSGDFSRVWQAIQTVCAAITAANGWGVANQKYVPSPAGGAATAGAGYWPPSAAPQRASGQPVRTMAIPVAAYLAGSIIGKGGRSINEMRTRSGATVKIEDSRPGAAERMVTIAGTQAQIDIAVSLLYAKLGGVPGGGAAAMPGYAPQPYGNQGVYGQAPYAAQQATGAYGGQPQYDRQYAAAQQAYQQQYYQQQQVYQQQQMYQQQRVYQQQAYQSQQQQQQPQPQQQPQQHAPPQGPNYYAGRQ